MLLNILDYQNEATRILSNNVKNYYNSGALSEETLRNNENGFRRFFIIPRVLVDVS